MNKSRTKNAMLTLMTSGIRQVLTLILTFVSRTVFIYILGAEYLGLNGLFSNILSLLSLSELGIGTAISFYLYKPLAEQNIERIKSLMQFYKKCYRVVGIAIIVIGCCLMPLLPKLVNFDQNVPENLYLVYFLYLINTAASYLFFAYKQALITANQEQYKIENVNIAFTFINCIADIVVLIVLKNYITYLVVRFLLVLLKNIIIAKKIDKEYPYICTKTNSGVTKKEIKIFFKDIWAVSLFRIGSTLFNATDNIIISMLLGTVVVGYYSNYYLIILQIISILMLIVRSFTAGIGNVVAKENREKQYVIFKQLDFAMYCITTVCTICLFQLLNSFIKLWVGSVSENYILSQTVVLCLCVSFYTDNTSQIMNAFREASGNFNTGKSLQLIGGIVNIILSVLLGKRYGLVGIFTATIISKGFVMIPFIIGVSESVLKKGKHELLKDYIFKFIVMFGIMALVWLVCRYFHMGNIGYFIIECLFAIMIPIIVLYMIFRKTTEMESLKNRVEIGLQKVFKQGR
jgi:O-antigen/teichoic acid export membrane protein